MAKVHVISTPERQAREADLVDEDADPRSLKGIWFYALVLNFIIGVIFIIMDVVYFDTCYSGLLEAARILETNIDIDEKAIPALLFLIGISLMSVSVIAPIVLSFCKNDNLKDIVRCPGYEMTKDTATLLARFVLGLSIQLMVLFVIVGLSYVSSRNYCAQPLVLFTQIVCSLYLIGFVILAGYFIFRMRQQPSSGHFSANLRNNGYSKNTVPPPTRTPSHHKEALGHTDEQHLQDNLSEVHLPDGHTLEGAKARHHTRMGIDSNEIVMVRYILVVAGVIFLIAAVPGIPILALGATYHDRCSSYINVPVWLIVQGTMLLVGSLTLLIGWCIGRGETTIKRLYYVIPALIIVVFVLIWPIVGMAWSDQARTQMLTMQFVTGTSTNTECTRNFITGVLVTASIYSIPFLILSFIFVVLLASVAIVLVIIFIQWSLSETGQLTNEEGDDERRTPSY